MAELLEEDEEEVEDESLLDQMIDINQVEGRVRASSLKQIGEIVDKHPEEAIAIVRNWMYQEGGAWLKFNDDDGALYAKIHV